TTQHGLAHNTVWSILQDREGYLWFGTVGGGVSRYDGQHFKSFTTQEGLAHNRVHSIFQDREGYLWFGTDGGGVSRYDGQTFTTFTTQDGLADNSVWSILQDQKGHLWFATDSGVSWYDGQHFKNLTAQDEWVNNDVNSILQDREGHLWFGTWGGVVRYDGQSFQTIQQKDGLAGSFVGPILQDRDEWWFGTSAGVTRFRPPPSTPPPVFIDAVVAGRRYERTEKVEIPSTVDLTAFEFHGISFKTRPEAMVYRYRLKGYAEDWKNTHEQRVEYPDLPVGDYTFEVLAVDRDLNYSEKPATAHLTIHPPYGTIALGSGLAVAVLVAAVASGYAVRRRRQLFAEMARELQTAHELQMSLMPRGAPQLPGLDLAGRCLPANHVGGDLFQYFSQEGKFSIALADVTGHAMEAAIPMVMFSGILKSQMETGSPVGDLFGNLNRSLHGALSTRTFICFALGELDPVSRRFCFANAGCPYPYHDRAAAGEVVELQLDAYPLGVRPDTAYKVIEVQLEPGDRVVFCSDGIIDHGRGEGVPG
ncbi:MAG: SpoIIE family protein phosphatase, partial [Candidatus Latescibacteria bacterium]|nr:SpoIIE family protein phosphatase [Candidatus Latescibacterota bacterium]